MRRLDSGATNTVIVLGDGKRVMRISLVFDDTTEDVLRKMRRGIAIQQFFSRGLGGEKRLGPALARNVSPNYETFKTLPPEVAAVLDPVRDRLLLQVQENNLTDDSKRLRRNEPPGMARNRLFFTTTMELLDMNHSSQNWKQHAFFLCWFLASAQVYSGFIHRDIKPQNLGYRQFSEKTTTYTFKLEHPQAIVPNAAKDKYATQDEEDNTILTDAYFSVTVKDRVPVFIDYDMSCVYLTDDDALRRRVGTVHYAPPDVLCEHINLKKKKLKTSGVMRLDMAYDWWSLGFSLLYIALDLTRTREYAFPLTLNNAAEFTLEERCIFEQYKWLTTVIHEDYGDKHWPYVYQLRYPFLGSVIRIVADKQAKEHDPISKKLKERFLALGDDAVRFFRQILAWDPEERIYYGEVFRFLLDFFPEYRRSEAPASMTMKMGNINNPLDWVEEKDMLQRYPGIGSEVEPAEEKK